MVSQEVGYDSGKKMKGRKRHMLVDTLGLLIVVVITAGSISEQAGAKQVRGFAYSSFHLNEPHSL
jgi:putative transposase